MDVARISENEGDGSLFANINGFSVNYNSIVESGTTTNCRETTGNFQNRAFEREENPTSPSNEHAVSVPAGPRCLRDQDYDPHDYTNPDNPTTFWGTVFHIIIVAAGPAVLSIPSASIGVGYVTMLILVPLIVFLYNHNMHMVVWSEYRISKLNRVPGHSYPEVVYHAFQSGPRGLRWFAPCGRILCYVVFINIWFFFCCYNYIIICQNLKVFLWNVLTLDVSVHFLVVIFLPVFVLLCYIRKLSYLVPLSIIGNIANYIAFVLVVYYIVTDPSPWNIPHKFGTLGSIPLSIGTIMFTLNATGLMIPLKHEMKTPQKFNSRFGVLNTSFVPVAALYMFLSLIGYLKYGSDLKDSVIENLPPHATLAQAGILVSSSTLIFQYPLFMYVNVDMIWNNILKERKKSLESHHRLLGEYVLRTVLVVISFVISYVSPNIFLFLSLSGTIGTSIDSFILPAFMQTLVVWRICKSKWRFSWVLVKNALIVSLAVVVVVGGVMDCVQQVKTRK